MAKKPARVEIIIDTRWEDTGFDCDHCGGRVLKRIDRETGLADRVCFQCEECGCQWSLAHRPLRVGTKAACRAAQRARGALELPPSPYTRWLLMGLGVVVLLVLLRFGGGAILRVAIPALFIGLAAAAVLYVVVLKYRDED